MSTRFTLLPPESTSSTTPTSLQRDWEGEEELVSEDDDEPPSPDPDQPNNLDPEPQPGPEIDLRPKKKAKRLKNLSSTKTLTTINPTTLNTTSPIELTDTVSSSALDDHLIDPKRPKIKSNNAFWRKAPPPPSSSSSGGPQGEGSMRTKHTEFPFADYELGLRPLTWPSLDDTAVKTLGIPASLPSFQNTLDQDKEYDEPFLYTRSDLIRYRLGITPNYTTQVHAQAQAGGSGSGSGSGSRGSKDMTVAEGAWKKWEEIGGIPKGLAGLIPYSFDGHGNVYKPDLTHVQAIRLVIAASPRGKMTLSQIYQAFEERWPWHKTAGMTWKNSIRHNLSLNDCFINVEKATAQGGGKGGYWIVDNSQSGRTARKLKRSATNLNSNSTSKGYSSSPTKSTFKERDLLTKDRLSISGESSPNTETPSVDVFSPGLSNPLDKYDLNKNSDGGMGKGKNKATSITIAKPAVPFPYTLPKRDKSWVPKEVVRKSREIGIQRPSHDTPLDRPQKSSSHPSVDGRADQDHAEGEGCSRSGFLQTANSPLESQFFTTRAGVPVLPMVEPKSNSRSNLSMTQHGERDGISKLPNLLKAMYEPSRLGWGLGDDMRLPPVRVAENQMEDGDDEGGAGGDQVIRR
ncbi:hypothetical protein I203_104384 [Kwoniella mangroviensis CBS 8507]|uniref:uncharacterized protein n=1 Tax=Kwoniella mangroviensis CBS 8507 TaxID=1296122 RepID=UPI00080CFE4F|nr:uncharacterized protein I203_00669 [Kwoniella mangroviensis CBS 8507]OCF70534.1 hypothetical protein I203_00669 [Kwoniella mangroviensis CBS 8507]